jgi:hypothetical protein
MLGRDLDADAMTVYADAFPPSSAAPKQRSCERSMTPPGQIV